ncbi:MAG: tsaB [Bacilli bacterium]|nr:tsaB [Bacilli bacterium]
MPYLAIDTSNYALSVAIGDDQSCLGEASTFVDRNHSNKLMPLIESFLAQLEISPADLTGIIVGKGPGSYTGVRIGVTAAKTLAWALKIPLTGVSSLLAMAYTAAWPGFITCPLIDARRRQVYGCAVDTWQQASPIGHQPMIKEAIWPLDIFLSEENLLDRKLVFVGNGAQLHRETIQDSIGERARFASSLSTGFARALHLLQVGSEQIKQGLTEDPYQFEPEYLQQAEAEAKLTKNLEARESD